MVIAPLLGPSVALALASALGDVDLSRKALKTSGAGILVALSMSIVLGALLEVDTSIPEVLSRTEIELSDIVLAICSGVAGTLAFTSGLSSTLIGVMVAVALLPPLVTTGFLFGSNNLELAWGAALLFIANFISVNLAGVITFYIQGVRPLNWYEEGRAKKLTAVSILIWTLLLALLVGIIIVSKRV